MLRYDAILRLDMRYANQTREGQTMAYYATVKHYSVVGSWELLRAKTELGAKREAWSKYGSGYIGHVVHVIEAADFEDIHRQGNTGDWCREIGSGHGWYNNKGGN